MVLDQLGPGTGDDAVAVRPGVDLRPRTRAPSTATATVGTSAMSGTFTATSTSGTSVAPGTSVSNALEHHPTGKGVVSPVDGPPAHPGGFEPFPPLRKMRRQDTRDVPGSSARRVPAFGQGSGDVRRQLPRRVRRCTLPGNGLACAGLALRTLSCQGLGPLPAPRPPRSAAVITPHHRPFSGSFRKTCQIRGMNRRDPAEKPTIDPTILISGPEPPPDSGRPPRNRRHRGRIPTSRPASDTGQGCSPSRRQQAGRCPTYHRDHEQRYEPVQHRRALRPDRHRHRLRQLHPRGTQRPQDRHRREGHLRRHLHQRRLHPDEDVRLHRRCRPRAPERRHLRHLSHRRGGRLADPRRRLAGGLEGVAGAGLRQAHRPDLEGRRGVPPRRRDPEHHPLQRHRPIHRRAHPADRRRQDRGGHHHHRRPDRPGDRFAHLGAAGDRGVRRPLPHEHRHHADGGAAPHPGDPGWRNRRHRVRAHLLRPGRGGVRGEPLGASAASFR